MSEAPTTESAIGFEADDSSGTKVGSVHGVFVDAKSGEPAWLIVDLGRRRSKLIAVPVAETAAAAGRVWIAQEREVLRSAPLVDPTRPLLREHELAICEHYGIGERVGRAAAVAERPPSDVTARPA
jgi:hypothetical protein